MQPVFKGNPSLHLRQRGMATILIIILAGMALTVTAMGVMYSVRTSQQQQVSVHAATNAQAGVWAAAEAILSYLENPNVNTATDFTTPQQRNFSTSNNNIENVKATITQDKINTNHLRAIISYTDIAAKASSTLEVVYHFTTPSSILTGTAPEIYMAKGLNLSGNAKIIVDENTILNVIGILNFGNSTIDKISIIRTTESIILNKKIQIGKLYSDKNITMTGSLAGCNLTILDCDVKVLGSANAGGYLEITDAQVGGNANAGAGTDTMGYIAITRGKVGSASAGAAITVTNGTVDRSVNAGAAITMTDSTANSASAGAALTITDSTVDSLNAAVAITITRMRDDSCVGNANSGGAMTITDGCVGNANAGGAMTVTAGSVGNANAGGAMTVTGTGVAHTEDVYSPVSVLEPIITPVPKLDLTPPKIDAYLLKDTANYVFSYSDKNMRVEVKSIAGIDDGKYYLDESGNIYAALKDKKHIRENILFNICQSKKCEIEYDSKKERWDLEGDDSNKTVFTPGILWFEGNVALEEGTYRNSIIATGSITTDDDDVKVYAVHYNGYEQTCKSTSFYPTNLCDTNSLKSNPIGSIALLAGSYVDNTSKGGTITLNDDTTIFGSVIAGDILILNGKVNIKGYISTAGQGNGVPQSWASDVTIDVTNLPDNTYIGETPNMRLGGGNDPDKSVVKILWSRYL